MMHLDIGLSAIRAAQQGLFTVSNNIANANTAGYHRQRVELVDRPPSVAGGLNVGSGVQVAGITRLTDLAAEVSLTGVASLQGESQATLDVLRQIETALLPTDGSLMSAVTEFFNRMEQLGAQPSERTIRDSVVAAGEEVLQQLDQLNTRFNQLRQDQGVLIEEEVVSINETAANIATLNQQIRVDRQQGGEPNTLLDQRDRLISELASRVDVFSQSLVTAGSPILAAAGWLVIGEQATQLSTETAENGSIALTSSLGQGTVVPASGRLAGMLESQRMINTFQDALHDWASVFVNEIDRIQSSGLGQREQTSLISGTRSIANSSDPLGSVGVPFPLDAGTVSVSITNTVSGTRNTTDIPFDPAVDSLNDLLGRLNAIAELSATYDAGSGTVTLQTTAGHTMDFVRADGAADQTGLLAALGIHSFFTGNADTGFGIDPEIQNSSLRIAVSRTGAVGDSNHVERYVDLRQRALFADGQETLEQRLISLTTATAYRIEAEESSLEYLQNQEVHLGNARDAVSGVDPNEELIQMLEYQRMFQAASRFVTSVDETLDELFRLVG
ncbi:MAG: flagellar hook-associated protein FlgK [Planctomycetaceae bacterium]|nr:flagellar hook-associated protein FlgK [Planctomycetaceae bacterium]